MVFDQMFVKQNSFLVKVKLLSHRRFYYTVNCYLSFLLTYLLFNEVILLSARSAETFTHF